MLPSNPADLKRRYQQAVSAIQTGQLGKAEADLRALAPLMPKAAEVPFQLSRIAEAKGDLRAAAAHLEKALTLKPDEPALHGTATRLFATLGDADRTIAAHDALIRLDPKGIKPRADKAHYLQSVGRFGQAEEIFRNLLKKTPESGELYRMLMGGLKMTAGDPLLKQMRRAWANPKLPKGERMHLGFALAKAMEDIGSWDDVFGYLKTANALQAKAYPFDPHARDQEVTAVLDAQAGPLTPIKHRGDLQPIFVTGMPRSGTTLVEQIIASHSKVTAGGELAINLRLAYHMFGTALSATKRQAASEDDLGKFVRTYDVEVLKRIPTGTGVVTDKSIQSHLILGLLYRAFPEARFIVVHRDPRDVAVSIYKNFFRAGTHRYANDLRHIARYIKSFQRAVDHWRDRLPDRFYEISYDELVAQPEPQSRALIKAAGLEWEDACLDFHNAKTAVRTLSLSQVRQPINASRSQAWRRYESELEPFIEEWESF